LTRERNRERADERERGDREKGEEERKRKRASRCKPNLLSGEKTRFPSSKNLPYRAMTDMFLKKCAPVRELITTSTPIY
jgi:hypothetical protein